MTKVGGSFVAGTHRRLFTIDAIHDRMPARSLWYGQGQARYRHAKQRFAHSQYSIQFHSAARCVRDIRGSSVTPQNVSICPCFLVESLTSLQSCNDDNRVLFSVLSEQTLVEQIILPLCIRLAFLAGGFT